MERINMKKAKANAHAVVTYAKQKEYEFLTYKAIHDMQEEGIPNGEIANILGIETSEASKKTSQIGLERARARMLVARGLLESY